MLKINIDLWLKHGEKMNVIGHRVLELARDAGLDVDEMEIDLKMWNMVLSDMIIVQAGRNIGGDFEVV